MTPARTIFYSVLCAVGFVFTCCHVAQAQTTRKAASVTITYTDGTTETVDAAPATQPAPPETPASIRFLGLNVPTLTDYSGIGASEVCNLVWTSRGFRPPAYPYAYSGGPALDPEGNPTGDFGLRLITEGDGDRAGVYTFRATGEMPDVLKVNRGNELRNLQRDPATGRITAEIVIPVPADPAARKVTLELIATGTKGGLKDVEVLPPGITDTTKVFTPAFYKATGDPFFSVRFMGALGTNDSTVVSWHEHTGGKTWERGMPPTAALTWGTETGKPVNISVPALASDDYVRQLGAAIRARGPRAPPVYVEYSNEVWNGVYAAFKQNEAATLAAIANGDTRLTLDSTDPNLIYAAWRRVAQRSVEIKELLADCGDAVRVVIAPQVNRSPAGQMLKVQLEYVERYHGPPRKFFYGTATAPYFSPGRDPQNVSRWLTQRDDLTVDMLIAGMADNAPKSAATAGQIECNALARKYGLKSIGYELGVDLQAFGNLIAVKAASQYDPRMGPIFASYLRKWFEVGGDEAWILQSHGAYKRTGYWGLSEDILDLDTPKRNAAEEVAAWLRAAPN